jgi:uncharacterized integral membrane protein
MRREEDEAADRGRAEDEAAKLDADHLQRLRRTRQARVAKVLVALAVLVIFVVFIIGNSDSKEIDFVFVESRIPLIWVMLGCAILGGITGFVLGRPGKQVRFHRREDDEEDRGR